MSRVVSNYNLGEDDPYYRDRAAGTPTQYRGLWLVYFDSSFCNHHGHIQC